MYRFIAGPVPGKPAFVNKVSMISFCLTSFFQLFIRLPFHQCSLLPIFQDIPSVKNPPPNSGLRYVQALQSVKPDPKEPGRLAPVQQKRLNRIQQNFASYFQTPSPPGMEMNNENTFNVNIII
jgi:hypothetical protein